MNRTFNFYLIITFAIFTGCELATDDASTTASQDGTHTHADGTTHVDHGGHSHDNPPHGGTYADWGGGAFHVEFTVDHDKQQATVYILGDDAVTDAPIEAEEINLSIADPKIQIALKAEPQASDGEGKSSRFVGTHENLGIVQEYEGKIYGSVDGKAYSGDFKEEAHEH